VYNLINYSLDTGVTPGILPSALWAMLRMFKIVPDDFVAGMTSIPVLKFHVHEQPGAL
jgi:hypothetical protein